MGEFRKNLLEKVNSRNEMTKEVLLPQERLQKESQNLQNALVFLEKTAAETEEGWYINSYKELTAHGLKGKLSVLRKKVQRRFLHWYLEPVCDDQSAYNQKIQRALTAMEDFAKAQMDWNRIVEGRYEEEERELKRQLAQMEEKLSEMEKKLEDMGKRLSEGGERLEDMGKRLSEGGERLADMENWLGRSRKK